MRQQSELHADRIDEYAARAKAAWGDTPAYREYAEKSANRTREEEAALGGQMMDIFAEFGAIRHTDPSGDAAQALVRKLQSFITEHFYTCSDEILRGLGQMYAAGGDFTANIERRAGEGTAIFAHEAIEAHCGSRKDA